MSKVSILGVGGPTAGKVVVQRGDAVVEHWPGEQSTYEVAGQIVLTGTVISAPNISSILKIENDSGGTLTVSYPGGGSADVADGEGGLLFCDGTNVSAIGIPSGGGGGGGYTASAVNFDGTGVYLSNAALTAVDSSSVSWSYWFKASATDGMVQWVVDPDGNYSNDSNISGGTGHTDVNFEFNDDNGNSLGINYFDFTRGDWHSVIVSVDTNHAEGLKVAAAYLDGVLWTPDSIDDASAAFLPAIAGLPFFFGDDSFGDGYVGDFADFRFMVGTSLLSGSTIPDATLRLFIDADGKPVDPATATATLGTPTILFTGNAAAFVTNHGSGGAFTLTGSLTNASTSPSDA